MPEERISEVRDYYRSILPFYEKESVSRAHLAFWRDLARELRPNRILELGAGFGRITAALSAVAPCLGVDVSLEMLATARRRRGTGRARFAAADIRAPIARESFGLIVAPGDPISHVTSLSERRMILRSAAAALTPGGRVVVEGLYRRRHQVTMPVRRVRYATGVMVIEEAWFPVGVGDLWHARYRYRDRDAARGGVEKRASAAFVARSWNPATVRDVFASAGLRVEALWGDFDRRRFTTAAPRMIIVASRKRP